MAPHQSEKELSLLDSFETELSGGVNQKKHFFHLIARVTRSSVASEHLKVPQPTLQSRLQPKNKTSDTSQTDWIRNALETTCENKHRGTNTLREL